MKQEKIITLLFFFTISYQTFFPKSKFPASLENTKSFYFTENKGQLNSKKFDIFCTATTDKTQLLLTPSGLTYLFFGAQPTEEKEEKLENEDVSKIVSWNKVEMVLENAAISKKNIFYEQVSEQGYYNYYQSHCPQGFTEVKSYKKVIIKNVYPLIDWVFYSHDNGQLKYDFIIHPGGNASDIRVTYKGISDLSIHESGEGQNIQITHASGTINEGALLSYESDSKRNIYSTYKIHRKKIISNQNLFEYTIGFSLKEPITKTERIIDPPLTWGTYYGSSFADGPRDMTIDNSGNIYIAGYTFSSTFPLDSMAGAFYQGTTTAVPEAFLMKFSSVGARLWSTYYGGSSTDKGKAVTVDNAGNVYYLGHTSSTDLPLKNLTGAYNQATKGGLASSFDAFFIKFNAAGVRQWASYYGGSGSENDYNLYGGWGADTDANGNVYFVGYTESADLYLQNLSGAYNQAAYGGNVDAFIVKINPACAITWATYYGGSATDLGYDVACDATGNVYMVGYSDSPLLPTQNPLGGAYFQGASAGVEDGFIAKFDFNNALVWGTYFGGNFTDKAHSVEIDNSGNVFVCGSTNSTTGFPTQALAGAYNQAAIGGSSDIFAMEFSSAGVLLWSTYCGGPSVEGAYKVATDIFGNAFVVGDASTGFPTVNPGNGAFYQGVNGGSKDACILQFDSGNNLYWSTFYGGGGGSADDWATGVITNTTGCTFVTGEILSNTGAALNNLSGAYYQPTKTAGDEAFITQFCCIQPTLSVSSNTTICSGSPTTLTVTGASQYTWAPGTGLNTTTGSTVIVTTTSNASYTVTAADNTGCTTSTIATISVIASPTVTISTYTAVCSGQTIIITASGGTYYLWNTGSTTQSISVNPVTNSVYTASVSNGTCQSIGSVTITVIPWPTANAGSDQIICALETATLNASGGINYQWSTGATTNTISVSPSNTSIYTVTVSDGTCNDTDAVSIIISIPLADAGTNETITEGQSITLNASGGVSYSWLPSINLNCSTCQSPVATPTVSTMYYVTVTDVNGCTAIDSVLITVETNCNENIFIPNAFSPNNDGENDFLKVEGLSCLKSFNLAIYNRWGEKVFDTNDKNFNWDGYFKGKPLDTGVFSYTFSATLTNGSLLNGKGNISLIR